MNSAEDTGKVGIVTNIQHYSLHDGPGIRTLVFLKGCPLKCRWCCNPETQLSQCEVEFYHAKCWNCGTCEKVCDRKAIIKSPERHYGFKIDRKLCVDCLKCAKACPAFALREVGKLITAQELFAEVSKDKLFYLTSAGGITLSGGEPLQQATFAIELLKLCYNGNIHTAVETCGFVSWGTYEKALPYLDLILYDVKHMDSQRHQEWTGVPNELILSNLKRLSEFGKPIIVRLPLIPGFNMDDENIKVTAAFLKDIKNIQEINLMPFHQFGQDKYEMLGRHYELKGVEGLKYTDTGEEKIEKIQKIFHSYDLNAIAMR